MKTTIKAIKLTLLIKSAIVIGLMGFGTAANADYYYGSSGPSCGSPCGGGRAVYETRAVTPIYAAPVKKVKYYRRTRSLGSYNMEVYYVWPTYAGPVWAPSCGNGCVQAARPSCYTPSCSDFYVPEQYYTSVSNAYEYMDERTGDDFYY
jgi:hypothetical protein